MRVSQHFLNVFILPPFAASTYTTEQLPASGTQVIYSSGPGVLHRHFQGLFCVAVTVWPVSDKDGDDAAPVCWGADAKCQVVGLDIPIMYTVKTAFLHLFFSGRAGQHL